MILAQHRVVDTYIASPVAPATGIFGYTRDDLVRARCPYAADPAKFAQFFVETCSCALHRAFSIALPVPN